MAFSEDKRTESDMARSSSKRGSPREHSVSKVKNSKKSKRANEIMNTARDTDDDVTVSQIDDFLTITAASSIEALADNCITGEATTFDIFSRGPIQLENLVNDSESPLPPKKNIVAV